MKTENIYFDNIDTEITYYVGKNAKENFDILDMSKDTDLWFHAKDLPSCHVIAVIPDGIDKKTMKTIIKKGGMLCKQNTNKLVSEKNLKIIYAKVSDVKKTEILGTVNVINKNELIVK